MPHVKVLALIVVGAAAIGSVASAGENVPRDLLVTVSKIHSAAAHGDYAALRTSMVQDFTWSFGGDGNIEQALSEWKRDPKYLKNLALVTQAKCGWIEHTVFQCPARAAKAFRAGFKQVDGTWKMVYFVAGD